MASLFLVVAAAVAAYALGALRAERILTTDAANLFFAGAFAVVVGTLAYRFWRLNEPSAHYFRWSTRLRLWEGEAHFLGGVQRRIALGNNRGEAYDLPPGAQRALCMLLALLVVLACLDARSLGLLGRFQRGLAAASSAYCPDVEEAVDSKQDPNAPGCALVRRAYALGYAKDLGDCGARKQQAASVCTLRQRDEPSLHYAWRLLSGAFSKAGHAVAGASLSEVRRDFDQRLERLPELQAARAQILASAPHASHHIWTNLPDPKDGAFESHSCADRYRSLPHRPPLDGDARQSRVFEHVLAQLLFEQSYEPAAGSCREYHVHWGAPPDACKRLSSAPEAFLRESGSLSDVRETLARQARVGELDALDAKAQKSQRQLDRTAFVSFQCYEEGEGPQRMAWPVAFDGTQFLAEEVHAAPLPAEAPMAVDRYAAVGSLLAGGFHYGTLMSEAGLEEVGAEASLEPAFAGRDFLLSRLYGLANVDIYLGPGWMAGRADLLEVYPYELHLRNFVRVFRRQYAQSRGRL